MGKWSELLATDPEVQVRFPLLPVFCEVVGLDRGPLSLMSTIEELLGRKSSSSSLEIWKYGRRDVTLTTWHALSAKVGTNFAGKHLGFLIKHVNM
jgi:hypothetical protein